MDFVSTLMDEIALEGLDGITIETLWLRLEQSRSFTMTLDEPCKAYLWNIVVKHPDLTFYKLPQPRPVLELFNRFDYLDPETGFWFDVDKDKLPNDIYPVHVITNGKDMGSCKDFDTRVDITAVVRGEVAGSQPCPLEEAVKQWGSALVMVAARSARAKALFGYNHPFQTELPDLTYSILERIGRSRYSGEITTGSNSLAVFEQPKTLFYHCKRLMQMNLLKKQVFNMREQKTNRHVQCRLYHLVRFYQEVKSKTQLLLENLCHYLEMQPNQRETTTNIRSHLGIDEKASKKLFTQNRSYIQVVTVPFREMYPDATAKEYLVKGRNKERDLKVVQLMRPYSSGGAHDDDDEDDDEMESAPTDEYPSVQENQTWLWQRPLLHQCYSVVEMAGPEGITQRGLAKVFGMAALESRLVLKSLQRSGTVTGIMKDRGRQRTSYYIAAKLVHQSQLTKEFTQQRQKMMELLQPSNSAQTPEATAAATPGPSQRDAEVSSEADDGIAEALRGRLNSPKTSALNSVRELMENPEAMELGESMSKANRSSKAQRRNFVGPANLTTRVLRRISWVLDAVQKARVVEQIRSLQKLIMENEQAEGCDDKIDKKSLLRILNFLEKNGKIKFIRTVIEAGRRQLTLCFVCDPSVTPADTLVKSAIEQSKLKHFGVKKDQRKRALAEADAEDDSMSNMEDMPGTSKELDVKSTEQKQRALAKKMAFDSNAGRLYGLLPKMKRAEVLHEYLWYLAYGYGEETSLLSQSDLDHAAFQSSTTTIRQQPSDKSIQEQIADLPEPPMYKDEMTWKRYLAPLPRHQMHKGDGWCLMSDLLVLLPVSLFLQIISLPYKVEGLPELLTDQYKSLYPITYLPFELNQQLLFARRYIAQFHDMCLRLCHMGLLSFGPLIVKEKDQQFVYVHRQAMLLDTTSSHIGYMKTVAPEGADFPQQTYCFNSEEDVKDYWTDLYNTAMGTNLGSKGAEDDDEDFGVTTLDEAVKPKTDIVEGILPGDRRGAAGLDSSMFCHLSRNWFRPTDKAVAPKVSTRGKKEPKAEGAKEAPTESKPRLKYVPRSKQGQNPEAGPASAMRILGPQEPEPEILKSRRQLMSKMKGNKEGRGVKRAAPKSSKMFGPPAKREKKDARKAAGRTRQYYDEADKQALARMSTERVCWSKQEDSVLLISKVASLLLGGERRGFIVPWTVVRDILHEKMPTVALDKTSKACQRRVSFALKNPSSKMNVSTYLMQAKMDSYVQSNFLNRHHYYRDENTPQKFKELVNHLIEIFRKTAGSIRLPQTPAELHQNFTVSTVTKSFTKPVVLKDVSNRRDICSSTLNNIIHAHAASKADKQGRSHEMYHIFKMYPDYLLMDVFTKMRKDGILVRQKKGPKVAVTKKPLIIRHHLSQKYQMKFLTKFPTRIFTESADFLDKLWEVYVETEGEGSTDVQHIPKGGFCATIVSLFCMKKLKFQVKIPSEILVLDMEEIKAVPHSRGSLPGYGKKPETSSGRTGGMAASRVETGASRGPLASKGSSLSFSSQPSTSTSSLTSNPQPSTSSSAMTANPQPSTSGTSRQASFRASQSSGPSISAGAKAGRFEAMSGQGSKPAEWKVIHTSTQSTMEVQMPDRSSSDRLSEVKAGQASRALFNLMQGSFGDIPNLRTNFLQDHFVINSCKVGVALRSESEVEGQGRQAESSESEFSSLFLRPEQAKQVVQGVAHLVPHKLELAEVWGALRQSHSEREIHLLEMLYRTVEDSAFMGLRFSSLQEKFPDVPNLQHYLDILCRTDAVLRVGVMETRYVCFPHARPWLIHGLRNTKGRRQTRTDTLEDDDVVHLSDEEDQPPAPEKPDGPGRKREPFLRDLEQNMETEADPSAKDAPAPVRQSSRSRPTTPCSLAGDSPPPISTYEKVRLVPRPWRKPEGHLNRATLRTMLETVLCFLMAHPGCPLSLVTQNFAPVLQPVCVQELVQMLEDLGCVKRQYIRKPPSVSLFSTPRQPELVSILEPGCIPMLEPTVDCTFQMGQFVDYLQKYKSGMGTSADRD